jgi:hypothetical protein
MGEIEQKLEALNCDPIRGMAKITMDETQPMQLRATMYRGSGSMSCA